MGIFERIKKSQGSSIGQYTKFIHGYLVFPKLEGEIKPCIKISGKEGLIWSLNNYLGLANHSEVRKVEAEAVLEYGIAHLMRARMMSGQTTLRNGYQAMVSIIDTLISRQHDVIVCGAEVETGKYKSDSFNLVANKYKKLKY